MAENTESATQTFEASFEKLRLFLFGYLREGEAYVTPASFSEVPSDIVSNDTDAAPNFHRDWKWQKAQRREYRSRGQIFKESLNFALFGHSGRVV